MRKITVFIYVVLIASLFTSCYMAKTSESYYGINTKTSKHVVYLIDISGSMEGKAETDLAGNVIASTGSKLGAKVGNAVGGFAGKVIKRQTNNQLTKLGKAKKELIPSIKGLSEDTYFTVMVFENRVKKWRKKLVPATKSNKTLATVYIEKLSSGGGTNIYESLEDAFALQDVETVFLLSDGEPSAGKITSASGIVDEVTNWNRSRNITIHTIGLGEDCDKNFMKELASKNNGTFIDK